MRRNRGTTPDFNIHQEAFPADIWILCWDQLLITPHCLRLPAVVLKDSYKYINYSPNITFLGEQLQWLRRGFVIKSQRRETFARSQTRDPQTRDHRHGAVFVKICSTLHWSSQTLDPKCYRNDCLVLLISRTRAKKICCFPVVHFKRRITLMFDFTNWQHFITIFLQIVYNIQKFRLFTWFLLTFQLKLTNNSFCFFIKFVSGVFLLQGSKTAMKVKREGRESTWWAKLLNVLDFYRLAVPYNFHQ